MKSVAIKMKSYAGNVHIVDNRDLRRRLFHFILVALGALALLYILLLGSMVLNIIERRSLEADARTLSTEVGDLELTYLSMSNKIDANLSRSMGFMEAKTKFITRQSLGSVGFINNEI